ncbi:porin PorA family protein [Corynebacterium epidermidicanis]|uniref:Putative DUF3068 family protein n=1 Tax=Corynebacterium epidermidicanis TaxID=1050174 RepID=A0A0G3GSL2_9CORY|nr:porin PorA family protein [Corynebacterium epidermidicanis]AKK04126.1 putative DUF3068 family protein [Corynebacterium epidermidicanis]
MRIPRPTSINFGLALALLLAGQFLPDPLTNPVRLLPTQHSFELSYEPVAARLFDATSFNVGTSPECPDAPRPSLSCFVHPATLHRKQTISYSAGRNRKETVQTSQDRITTDSGATVFSSQDTATLMRHSSIPLDEALASTVEHSTIPGFDRNLVGENRTGLQFTFPFASEWRSYQYFDSFGHFAYPIDFQDREDFDGTTVYRFHQQLTPRQLGAFSATGSAEQYYSPTEMTELGLKPQDAVFLKQFYAAQRTVWVEPKTGTVLNIVEEPRSFLARNMEEATRTAPDSPRVLFSATFALDGQSKEQQRDKASAGVHRLKAIEVLRYLCIFGAVVFGMWGVRTWRRNS